MPGWNRAVAFINGRIVTLEGEARTLRFRRRVLSIDDRPEPGDHIIDLEGRFVLPGLINAHDHLELNHYGALKRRERYGNAGEWIDDLRPVIRVDEQIRAKSRLPLADRLFIGALKNLLSGVTTVAHHNPLYRQFGWSFPVGLVRRFGWAHSLGMEQQPVGAGGEPGGSVAQRSASTPPGRPFIVHAAEGVDAVAGREVDTLDASGSLRANTVLVHGVAVSPVQWSGLFERGVSLVWCPASNLYLFGRTLSMSRVLEAPRAFAQVCLGSDSRLTGAADLLDELRVASCSGVAPDDLLRMVTSTAARVLRLEDAGRIRVGATADMTVIPAVAGSAAESLLRCRRADVALVIRRGCSVLGDPSLAAAFPATRVRSRDLEVDDRRRLVSVDLAQRIARCAISEPGVRNVDAN